jgi:hypothetical protein
MAFTQFDLADFVRCTATDDEGYRCILRPSHDGPHRWDRCQARDAGGHRCMLPPGHPGDHEPPWYDRDATPGELHRITYGGAQNEVTVLAHKAERIAARYGWTARSRTFTTSFLWRLAPIRWLAPGASPSGRLTVVYEFRPTDDSTTGSTPVEGNRRST